MEAAELMTLTTSDSRACQQTGPAAPQSALTHPDPGKSFQGRVSQNLLAVHAQWLQVRALWILPV